MSPINFLFFIFGIIISIPFVIFGTSYFSDNITTLAVITITAVIISSVLSLTVLVKREWILKKIYGTAKTEIDDIVTSVKTLMHDILTKETGEYVHSAESIIRKISARYTWVTTRKWMVNVTIGILAVFAGLAGSALIFKQNTLLNKQNNLLIDHGDKLKKQNSLLDTQNQLSEASRRSSLIFELTSILDLVNLEIAAYDKALGPVEVAKNERNCPDESNSKNPNCPKRQISPRLKGRIAALSRSLRPYYFLEVAPIDTSYSQNDNGMRNTNDELKRIKRPLSPERGQLLISLVYNGLEVNSSGTGYNFTHADLRSVNLHNAHLLGANLDGANLANSYLVGANLQQANLMSANLQSASLYEVNLRGAVAIRAKLTGANLTKADLTAASMRWSDFKNADLKKTKMYRTLLYDADFSESKNITADQIQQACIDINSTKLPIINNFNINQYTLHKECKKI